MKDPNKQQEAPIAQERIDISIGRDDLEVLKKMATFKGMAFEQFIQNSLSQVAEWARDILEQHRINSGIK